jgi:tetratricopeptide (TPR) repeat protein
MSGLPVDKTEVSTYIKAALALRDIPDYQAALTQLQNATRIASENVTVLLLLGITYIDLGELDTAESSLRKAATIAPDSSEVRLSLGFLLTRRGDYDQAIQQLEPLKDTDIYTPIVALSLATAYTQVGNAAKADELLSSAYTRWPDNAEIATQYGQVLLRKNLFQEAVIVLEKGFHSNPTPQVTCDLAGAYSVLQRYDQAISLYKGLLKSQSVNDRAWRGLAYCDLRQGRAEQALMEAEKAVALNDQHFRNWQVRADALLALGRTADAIGVIEKGIDLAKKAPDGNDVLREWIIQRVFLILQTQGVEKALEQLKREQESYPDQIRLWAVERDILFIKGDYAHALDVLDYLVSKGISTSSLALHYYHAYLGLDREEQANAVLQSMLHDGKLEDAKLDRIEQISAHLYSTGNFDSARSVFEHVLKIDPNRPNSLNNLAFLLMCGQQWERAEQLLLSAIDNSYKIPAIPHANLGYLYLRQKRLDLAIKELTIAEQLFGKTISSSTLHVADWYHEDFVSQPGNCFPLRSTSPQLVVRANVAIAYLLKDQPDAAIASAQRAINTRPEDNIGYRVLGCIYLHTNDMNAARSAWTDALTREGNSAEIGMIQGWLSDLK